LNADQVLWHVLLALAAVVAAGQLLGRLFRLLGQPPVIGEVLAGILLGPSLLGRVWPAGFAYLLPTETTPALFVIAQLGVILYMFAIGLELNTENLWHIGTSALAISVAGIVVPFLLGLLLAVGIHPHYGGPTPRVTFSLFLAVALSITAFPVLARILSDRGLTRTPLGQLALVCAAAGDVAAWCLLAIVTGVAKAQVDAGVTVLAWTAAFLAFMLIVVRPLIGRWLGAATSEITPAQVGAAMVALLLSALATQWIGIHALFGAFLLGAIVPHDSPLAEQLGKHLENTVVVLFLPAYFALTGMRTEIGLLTGWHDWLLCGLIILVATAGKFGGTLAAARLAGQSWRDSAALGALMNTRGLMELIVLNVGLDLGIISPRLFAMMVIMALVTTIATTPLLGWIRRGEGEAREGEAPAEPGMGSRDRGEREASASR
jgi:Kef-type K+ transport system membrane component KefB